MLGDSHLRYLKDGKVRHVNRYGKVPKVLSPLSDNALLTKPGPLSESRVRACPGIWVSPSVP